MTAANAPRGGTARPNSPAVPPCCSRVPTSTAIVTAVAAGRSAWSSRAVPSVAVSGHRASRKVRSDSSRSRMPLPAAANQSIRNLSKRFDGRMEPTLARHDNADQPTYARRRRHGRPGPQRYVPFWLAQKALRTRSEEHTSELQPPCNLVCRRLLEKKLLLAGLGCDAGGRQQTFGGVGMLPRWLKIDIFLL